MNTKHLKAKILDLAIRGKLVSQDPSEGNAAELLQKIREEKSELVKQKKIKEDKNASFIIKADDGKHYEQFTDGSLKDIEDEIPFKIPENWCWCRLTSLCEYGKCKNADPSELLPDSWILDLEDIEKGTGVIKKFPTFAERNSLSTKHVFTKGTVLYSKLRPYLNKVVIAPKDGFCTSEILPLDFYGAYINKFVQRLLMSPYFLSTVNMLTYGVKMPRLGTGEANQILLPLPTLSEQQRIVSAIEKAFEQIDIIEKNKLNLKTYIKQTKSKVLDLAIHGKLVKQNPQEGNAFELLEKIRNEKAELIKQKKIKEDKNASFIIKADDGKHYEQFSDGSLKDVEEEIPFEIPENWCWTKIKTVSAEILYGVSESAKSEGKYKLLRITDIQNNRVNWDKVPLTNYDETSVPQYLLKPGDLVFARTGATVGKSYLIEDKIENAIYASYLIRVRPSQLIDSKYIKYYFQSRPYWEQIIDRSLGNGQPNVNGTSLANLFIPLPPLSEQQRIVAKIEQVFEQLDLLEKSLGE